MSGPGYQQRRAQRAHERAFQRQGAAKARRDDRKTRALALRVRDNAHLEEIVSHVSDPALRGKVRRYLTPMMPFHVHGPMRRHLTALWRRIRGA